MNTTSAEGPGSAPPAVRHNAALSRFEIATEHGLAVLEYHLEGGTAALTHTEVPAACRGQGLAEHLTRAALAWADREHLKIAPLCSYVSRFIDRHQEFARLVPSGLQ